MNRLDHLKKNLRKLIRRHSDLIPEALSIFDPEVKERYLLPEQDLSEQEAIRLIDRIVYLTKHRKTPAMSKRPQCPSDKMVYQDEHHARYKANKIKETGRGTMRAYQCPLCSGWHLTHFP